MRWQIVAEGHRPRSQPMTMRPHDHDSFAKTFCKERFSGKESNNQADTFPNSASPVTMLFVFVLQALGSQLLLLHSQANEHQPVS